MINCEQFEQMTKARCQGEQMINCEKFEQMTVARWQGR